MQTPGLLRGVVRGSTIELERDSGLPDGQEVSVIVQPLKPTLPPGEGLRRAFGGWSDDPEGVDRFVEEMRRLREMDTRSGLTE